MREGEQNRTVDQHTFFLYHRLDDMVNVVVDMFVDDSAFIDNGSLFRAMALPEVPLEESFEGRETWLLLTIVSLCWRICPLKRVLSSTLFTCCSAICVTG